LQNLIPPIVRVNIIIEAGKDYSGSPCPPSEVGLTLAGRRLVIVSHVIDEMAAICVG
jgi:hypothetical protein